MFNSKAMTAEITKSVELPIGAIANGHLTTAEYLSVFNAFLKRLQRIRSGGSLIIDLSGIEWLDHMPLLGISLLVKECAKLHPGSCSVIMPIILERQAFLDRWGFFRFLDELQVQYETADNPESYKESQHSRVLPITAFSNMERAGVARDLLLKAEGNLLDVLRKQACLEEADISGLADLVIFELCKNVIEHSGAEKTGLVIAHASTPTGQMAAVRNEAAATWEKDFYDQIGEEGVTEVVVGDSGVGIVQSLRKAANERGMFSTKDILFHAFDPYSTSKNDRNKKTRGLWCVKQKVRDFGGLLYVRTCHSADNLEAISLDDSRMGGRTPGVGMAAYWDFLNNPDQDEPRIVDDASCFPGTQFQILLPQRNHDRPRTYVALHTVEGLATKFLAKPMVVPPKPEGQQLHNSLREAIRKLAANEVLFIDMSLMNKEPGPEHWDRDAIDDLIRVICVELVRDRKRLVWLLKPNHRTIGKMRFSMSVIELWRDQGLMIPVVRLKDDLSLPPEVFPVLSDPDIRTQDAGDTKLARERLVEGVWQAVGDIPQWIHEIVEGLTKSEQGWVEDSLSRNYAIAHTRRKQGRAQLIPEFAIHELARTAGMMLLGTELELKVHERIAQRQQSSLKWYRLTSGVFCKEYIDTQLLQDIDPWLRNRMDSWIEECMVRLAPKYVVSYTEFGNALLARAIQSRPETKPIHLGHYLDMYAPRGLRALEGIDKGDAVVLLVDISGSGKTLELLATYLEGRGAVAYVVCLIDTISMADRKRHQLLDGLYTRKRFIWLVRHPIDKVDTLPMSGAESAWPVSSIDPVSLLPVPEVLDSEKVMTDGEFWSHVARTGTLSTTPITYKGHEFGSFIWLTGIFKDSECAEKIAKHLTCCVGGLRPEKVLVTQATVEFLPKNAALYNLLLVEFKADLWLEGHSGTLDDYSLQNQRVAIFSAAATSGSGIARLLKRCGLASRVHICTFVNRMSHDITSTFVQKQGVTFSAFQRLYSASPFLRQRSYRTAALRTLGKYRTSCISNRLLLFVDEEIAVHQQTHTFVETPMELSESPEILNVPFDVKYMAAKVNYEYTTTEGRIAIEELILNWRQGDELKVLKAVLEEACCRYEAIECHDAGCYPEIVRSVYASAAKSQSPDKIREVVLSAMVLERLPGERFEKPESARQLYVVLWSDFKESVRRSKYDLATACLRSCAKLDQKQVLDNLYEACINCSQSRLTELSLSLELCKLCDDVHWGPMVIEALQKTLRKNPTVTDQPRSQDIAFEDLLRDLGLKLDNGSVRPMQWAEVFKVLATQPPDPPRTVRAAIRSIRRILPNSFVVYFRRVETDRYILADSWPTTRQSAGPVFPIVSSFSHKLIGEDGKYFTSDLVSERTPAAQILCQRMGFGSADKDPRSVSLFLSEVTAGLRIQGDTRRTLLGLLRVQVGFVRKLSAGINDEDHHTLADICNGACELLGRARATHVAKIGAWQYEHAVSGLGQAHFVNPEREQALQNLCDLMKELLEADIGRVAVLNADAHRWESGPVSGSHWEGSRREIAILDTDEHSATVKAAQHRKPQIIADVQHPGKSLPPNNWVHGCIALPLVLEGGKCDTVVTLWHHAPEWFTQFDDSLLESLAAIGGARIERVRAVELKTAKDQRQTIQTVSRHLAHTIKNRLPERPFIDLMNRVPELLKPLATDCVRKVKKISSMRRRFKHLAELDAFRSDGPYSALELFPRIEKHLKDIAEIFGLPIKSCIMEEFNELILCNRAFLEDDLLELLHNTDAHSRNRTARPLEVSFALRLAKQRDLEHSSFINKQSSLVYAVIEYSDTGPGIPKENKRSIFSEPASGRASDQDTESLGLGLPLARKLIRRLGGDMVECGTYGSGSCFIMFFKTTT